MSEPRYAVTIRMAPEDFTTLVQDGGPLSSIPPTSIRSRFRDAPERAWRYVYWVGDHYVNVLLARSYLEAVGEDCQVASDEAEWDNGQSLGWVIFTDYRDEARQ